MKLFYLVIALFSFVSFFTQEDMFLLKGKVVDDSTELPIPRVKIYKLGDKDNHVYTNEDGTYLLKLSLEKGDRIVFNHVGFDNQIYFVSSKDLKRNDNRMLVINQRLNYAVLPEVVIEMNKVDTVFGSPQYSVEDFFVLEEGRLLLLAYEKKLDKDPRLLLVNAHQQIIESYAVPGSPHSLFKDYAGKYYVVGNERVYQINRYEDKIALQKVSNEDFYGFYCRVIDTIGDHYYYSNYNELYPAVKFFVTERTDTSHHQLYEVKDDFMMELYRAQYKYVSGRDKLWAYRQEQATGIDKEIWIGASSFTQDILYRPVYAPLFVVNDTVLLFDQYKDVVLKFSEHHDQLCEIPIDYHLKKNKEKWEQPLLKDELTNNIYAVFERGGYTLLKRLDYQTGKTNDLVQLKFRFVERIKVEGNKVYYIYRPFESAQKKFIYSQELD